MAIDHSPYASQPQHVIPARAAAAFEQWRLAGLRVRLCAHPDEPQLISRYLAAAQELHDEHDLPRWDIALESAWQLVAVAGDEALPLHWRNLCLDHVHRPLATLDRLCNDNCRARQRTALRWKLAQLDLDPMMAHAASSDHHRPHQHA